MRSQRRLNFPVLAWNIFIHVGAIGALFSFSINHVLIFLGMYFFTHGIGIEVGYHRLLSHRSFQTPRWITLVIATLGVLCMQGGPIQWVAHHRTHHACSDQEGDPHNARLGFWHAHWLWFLFIDPALLDRSEQRSLVPDLASEPYFRWLEHWQVQLCYQALLAAGLFFWGGIDFVVWGEFVRLVASNHCTFFVNSASHFFGYRTFPTDDLSRNNLLVALVTWGDGWHNNHHAFPRAARVGLRWWEFDPGYWIIRSLESLGLASGVRHPPMESLKRLSGTTPESCVS